MKKLLFLTFVLGLINAHSNEALFSERISPHEAWKFLTKSRYKRLPFYKVTYGSFFSRLGENMLLEDSERTVRDESHFIPFQKKLIFPNGICVRGSWDIDSHEKGYSGYFGPKKKGVIIGRFASATSKVFYRQHRTIGLSGKVFPTVSPKDPRRMEAANFVSMNAGGGGNNKEYVTEAFLTNAAPSTVPLRGLPLLRIGLAISNAFKIADERRDIRQLYPIAELGETGPVRSPKWVWFKASDEDIALSHKLGLMDFRDEVMGLMDTRGSLSFDIMVSDKLEDEQPVYSKIGKVQFNKYVASAACDQSIHFQHVPYLEEYSAPEVDQKPKKIRARL